MLQRILHWLGYGPDPDRVLSRDELIDFATHVERRFDAMLAVNPPECYDVILPPCDFARSIRQRLSDTKVDRAELVRISEEILDLYDPP